MTPSDRVAHEVNELYLVYREHEAQKKRVYVIHKILNKRFLDENNTDTTTVRQEA
jgi:hypothetical protein